MADINVLLKNIKKAIYGRDVRDSIHDAIKQCYQDASGGFSGISRYNYDNVNDMKSDESLSAGDYVSTLGYYTKMDGGGANYLISDSNNLEPDAHTKYVYITLNNGLYAVLQKNDLCKWVNVLQAGLPRNFGQSDWDKIRPSNITTTYFFPSGKYTLTEKISMGIEGARDNGVGAALVGESFNQSLDTGSTVRRTVIDCTAVTSGACFKWGGGAHIRDMVFVHTNGFVFDEDRRAYDTNHTADKPFAVNMTDADSGNGIIGVKAGYDNVIENCTFYGFSGYGVYCTGLVRFINNKVLQCNTGIWTGTDSIVTHNSFKACYTCALVASMTLVENNRVDSCYYFTKVPGSLCVIAHNNIDWAWLNGIYVTGNDNIIADNTGRFAICAFTDAENLKDRYAYRIEATGNKVSAILHVNNITDGNVPDSTFVAKCIYTTKSGNVFDITFGDHIIESKDVMDTYIYAAKRLTGAFRFNGLDYWMKGYSSVRDADLSHITVNMFGELSSISAGTIIIPTVCNNIVSGVITKVSGASGVYEISSDSANVSNHVFGVDEPCNVAIKNAGSKAISGGALQIRDVDAVDSVATQTIDKDDIPIGAGEIIRTTYNQPMYTYPALRMTAGNYKLKVVFYTGTLSDTELENMFT